MTNSYVKTLVLILMTSIMIGCGGTTKDEDLHINSLEFSNGSAWEGTIKKTDLSQEAPIKIVYSNGKYKINYPSLSCVGELNLLSSSNNEMVFRINIIEGTCPTDGIIKMQTIDEDQVQFYQFNQNGNLTDSSNVVVDKKQFSGQVKDEQGHPVFGMNVKLEYLDDGQEQSAIAQTNSQGYYSIAIDEDKFKNVDNTSLLIYAYKDGYIPVTRSFKINANRNFNIDFTTNRIKANEMVLEIEPKVHHLGDDMYGGSINSQFQKNTEGTGFQKTFYITEAQYQNYTHAELTFSGKGIQYVEDALTLNNKTAYLEQANIDGSYKTYRIYLDKTSYHQGENSISITSAQDGDYDDFEFANIIIRFGEGSYQGTSTTITTQPAANTTYTPTSSSTQGQISTQLNQYITHQYSYAGQGIFVVGKKNGAYSFYRFNAHPIKLEKSFYNISINSNATITAIVAKQNGTFVIYTNYGNYMFNYFDGQLTSLSTNQTQQPNRQNNTSQNTSINTGFISTYSHGGFFKITDGNLARYAADGTYEALIVSNVKSIIPLPKGKVMVLRTADKIQVIDYIDPPYEVLYSTLSDLDSIQGGRYSNGVVYLGSRSIDVSEYVY